MRKVFIALVWILFFGTIVDILLTGHALYLATSIENVPYTISVDEHLRNHISWLYWVKPVAYAILPNGFVDWIFALPSAAYFTVRGIVSTLLGLFILSSLRKSRG